MVRFLDYTYNAKDVCMLRAILYSSVTMSDPLL